MTKEKCELPRNNHSQRLKTPMIEIETEAILATNVILRFFTGLRAGCLLGLVTAPSSFVDW